MFLGIFYDTYITLKIIHEKFFMLSPRANLFYRLKLVQYGYIQKYYFMNKYEIGL